MPFKRWPLQRRSAGSEDRIPPLLYLKIQSLLCVRIAGALSELTLNGHQRRIRCSAGIDTRNQSSFFSSCSICFTIVAQAMTGQNVRLPERDCVIVSSRISFFWNQKVMDTESAL
jgi:hypothetical protein